MSWTLHRCSLGKEERDIFPVSHILKAQRLREEMSYVGNGQWFGVAGI